MSDNSSSIPTTNRYLRSVHLQRDFGNDRLGVRAYQVTPLVVQTTERIVEGLRPESRARAFSLIGPYGAGKSAYGVFLAHFLKGNPTARHRLLAEHGMAATPATLFDAPMLLPVLVSGNNSSLRAAVLRALQRTIEAMPPLRDGRLRLPRTIADTAALVDADPQQVADLVAEASTLVAERTAFAGLVLVIDELGQFLDFAARQGDERDLFVLQTLAEMAARSGTTPCLLLTILHQAFDRYTATAGATRRAEWAKVQGRFVDLPFQEPPTQMLRMVASALTPDGPDPYAGVREAWAAALAPETERLALRPPEIAAEEWQQLIARAFPVHPLVLVALPLLFRQLAQNERSLFAFLTSREPWSVQDTLLAAPADAPPPVYHLSQLYAYVAATLGASLFGRARGQRWAELAEARAQLPEGDSLLTDVLTTIGTLGALGQTRGLKASRAHMLFALRDQYAEAAIERALNELEARKHIAYRQHRDSFVIWEGSDLDLDGLTQAARREISDRVALIDLLHQHADSTPIIARRHSYRSGAVRFFNVRFVEAASLGDDPFTFKDADGEILYIVPTDDEALGLAYMWAIHPDRVNDSQRIITLPEQVQELRDLLLDVAALNHVLTTQQELEGDRPARRELSSRLVEAQQVLSQTLVANYGPGASQWFWQGRLVSVRSAKQLDNLLSDSCDATYPLAPRIWNELIVRRLPSAAATKARRNLIEAMLKHPHDQRLGIEGYPPERAMYTSVLEQSGLHRIEEDGIWRFGSPRANDPFYLQPVWDAIEQFLTSSEAEEQPITVLFALLEHAPYGVKSGVIPILFMAVYGTKLGEVALYEHQSYVPVPDIATFERLLRQPQNFAVRLSRVTGSRQHVYERAARALAPRTLSQTAHPAILDVVTPLLRLVRALPAYSQTTKRVSEPAQAIRRALLETHAPDELLFTDLPIACEMLPFAPDSAIDESLLDAFFGELRIGLQELQAAYEVLVQAIREHIRAAFGGLATDSQKLHAELTQRYQNIAHAAADTQVKAIGVRLESAGAGDAWVESVAALIGRKSLGTWNDDDVQSFALQVKDWGRRFRMVEQIAVAGQNVPVDAQVVRIGIANGHGEHSTVLSLHRRTDAMDQLRHELETVLARYGTLTVEQRTSVLASLLDPLMIGEVSGNG